MQAQLSSEPVTITPPVPHIPPHPPAPWRLLSLSALGNLVILLTALGLSSTIFAAPPEFSNLGQPVRDFLGVLALLPVPMALIGTPLLLLLRPMGRYLTLVLQFGAAIATSLVLIQYLNVFDGFEAIVDGFMSNVFLLLGFTLAYLLFWLSNRFPEESPARTLLTNIALMLGMLTLVLLLLAANILSGVSTILDVYNQPFTLPLSESLTAANVVLWTPWLATIAMIGFGFLAGRMLKLGELFGETPNQRTAWQGWLMLAPNMVGFMLFFAGPLLLSFYFSFTDASLGQVPEVIGFENYTDLLSLEFQWREDFEAPRQAVMSFGYSPLAWLELGGRELVIGAKDMMFWRSIRNTLVFCLMLVPMSVIPALGLSMVLNSKLPGVKIYRAVYFVPSVAAVVGTALIWRWLYDPTIGFFNYIITEVTRFLSLTDPQIAWLTGPGVVLFSIVFLAAWQVVGFNTVLFLAGLQGIPNVLYEASQIDGANRVQRFRYVTLPMLAPTTFFVIVTTVIQGLQVFNEPYALFPARPIPAEATTAVYYMYDRAFPATQYGYASSVAWLLFGLIFLVTLAQFRLQRSAAYDS